MTPSQYDSFITSPFVDEALADDDGVHLVVIEGGASAIASPGSHPVVVCQIAESLGAEGPTSADMVVSEDEVDHVIDLVRRRPLAATALVTLLRAAETVPAEMALALESAAYSMLQAGPEFLAWRNDVEPRMQHRSDPVVMVARHGDTVVIELNRPDSHNAISAQMRDELQMALAVAVVDDSVARVVMRGRGASFSSGGDVREFGARLDPASAHHVRLARSPARSLLRISDRLEVWVHGHTLGGGLELASFARRVVAHPDSRLGLPEVAMGLIPGAGGTVSVSRRIGRQRTAALALAVDHIGAELALAWGLVDELDTAWSGGTGAA